MDALRVFRILTDNYSVMILEATHEDSKTATQLSRKYHIPIAACYRRIRWLEEAGVLKCVDRILSIKEKRIATYTSQLKRASIFCEKGKIKLKIELIDGKVMKFK